jgi:RNA polymerase sigma-70 factor (ECF subfamily)
MEGGSTDADLVRRIAAAHDRAAEAELCRRMLPRIRLYGLRHLRDAAAADDLSQQVMVATLEALRAARLREPEKLASFVLGTCRMTVLNQRRNAQRRARLLEEFGYSVDTTAQPDPEVESHRLSSCLAALAERERTVIVLTFYDEKTAADVAAAIGISDANVRVIRHRALHRLRACLGVAS